MDDAAPVRISALKAQVRDKNRVNVFVDGKYSFSLDVTQVIDLGVRVGNEYTPEQYTQLIDESQFGKLYTRSLEYVLTRPRSQREMRNYLYRKTRDTRTKDGGIKKGVSVKLTERVFDRLMEKGYLDDEKFARFWVENRNLRKGSSARKLTAELMAKGVEASTISRVLENSSRNDDDELRKVIAKKARRYDDERKFIAYLVGQGFAYSQVKQTLAALDEEDDQA